MSRFARAARLSTLVAILGLALHAHEAAAAGPRPLPRNVHCGPDPAPIPNFVPAKSTYRPAPKYPSKAENVWSEGWVVLNHTVAADGSVRDIIVTDALGPPEFVARTKQTFATWRYDPATRNGKPVDQYGMEFIAQFVMADMGPREAVHSSFVRRYNAARRLIADKKFAEAVAELDRGMSLRLNLYEVAMASFLFAVAHAQQGNGHQALVHIRRATIAVGDYLEKEIRTDAFALRVQLEAEDGNFKDAICAHEMLLKVNPAGNAAAAKLIEKIVAGLNNPAPLAVEAELSANAASDVPPNWWHPLLRSRFHFDQIQGEAKSFRLVCVATVLEAAVDPEMEWTVPEAAGECSLRVEGTPGTKFRLIEEW